MDIEVLFTQEDGNTLCFKHAVRQANRGEDIKVAARVVGDKEDYLVDLNYSICSVCSKIDKNLWNTTPINSIKELRKQSGCGMSDCKRALKECDWDITEALEHLRP